MAKRLTTAHHLKKAIAAETSRADCDYDRVRGWLADIEFCESRPDPQPTLKPKKGDEKGDEKAKTAEQVAEDHVRAQTEADAPPWRRGLEAESESESVFPDNAEDIARNVAGGV